MRKFTVPARELVASGNWTAEYHLKIRRKMADEKNSLSPAPSFDELVGRSDEEQNKQDLVLARRALKRKFAAAHDDTERNLLDEQAALNRMWNAIRQKPADGVQVFDINLYIARKTRLAQLRTTGEILKLEYRELFGDDIPDVT